MLISPLNNALITGTRVTFKWKGCTDPDGDTLTYYLYYCENEDFSGCNTTKAAALDNKGVLYAGIGISGTWLSLFGIALAGGIESKRKMALIILTIILGSFLIISCGNDGNDNANELIGEVSKLEPNTTYYWKVVADDSNGGKSKSETWSFTTMEQ